MYGLKYVHTNVRPVLHSMSNAKGRLKLIDEHIRGSRSFSSANNLDVSSVGSLEKGTKYTPDFKKYAIKRDNGDIISYFHDIPLDLSLRDKTANMIVEIPRWTNAKFEINTMLPGNPITQDVKKDKVRFIKNLFPFHGYVHNYGAFPQTWEDKDAFNEDAQAYGDNDPLDVCEIGSAVHNLGDVKRVKVLGSLALIDDGELDWKIITVDVNDPLSNQVNDVSELPKVCPHLLEMTRNWFRDYKLPDGKPQNVFAFGGEYKNAEETIRVLQKCSEAWSRLVNGSHEGSGLPVIENVQHPNTPGFKEKLLPEIDISSSSKEVVELDQSINKVYFFN